jgi:ribosomal-protein-alanine N-acetyltransferase
VELPKPEAALIIRLETERLLLEPFCQADAEDLFSWASDSGTTQYMGWKRHETLADSQAVIRHFERTVESEPPTFNRTLVFRDKVTKRPVGSGGLHQSGEDSVELGWILRPGERGKGYAHEAAVALHHFAMTELAWAKRVEVRIHPDNATSIRLALKLGYQPLEDGYFDMPQLQNARTRLLKFGVVKGGA